MFIRIQLSGMPEMLLNGVNILIVILMLLLLATSSVLRLSRTFKVIRLGLAVLIVVVIVGARSTPLVISLYRSDWLVDNRNAGI